MRLGPKQRIFSWHGAGLIQYAYTLGFEIAIAYAYRPTGGHPDSNHKRKLALDLDLFFNGRYQTTTAAHTPLGLFWEGKSGWYIPGQVHAVDKRRQSAEYLEFAWGGRFGDGNHYSIRHNGIR